MIYYSSACSTVVVRISHEKGNINGNEAVEQFLASLCARQTPLNTIKAYAHDLRYLLAAVPSLFVEVIAPLIQAFLQGDEYHRVATRGRRYSSLAPGHYMLATEPPSTRRFEPVMNEAVCDARKTTAAATSSGVPALLSSIWGRFWRKKACSASCGVIPLSFA